MTPADTRKLASDRRAINAIMDNHTAEVLLALADVVQSAKVHCETESPMSRQQLRVDLARLEAIKP